MIKVYCDCCQKELTGEIQGKLAFTERATNLIFNKKKTQDGLIQMSYDLCPACLKTLREALKI